MGDSDTLVYSIQSPANSLFPPPLPSGHLHTAYGHVPAMHAIQESGTLELEAADWKDGRGVRLLAIDHGLLVCWKH